MQSFEIPGMPGANVGMVNVGDILENLWANKKIKKKENDDKKSLMKFCCSRVR